MEAKLDASEVQKIRFASDAGHGWLGVPVKLIRELGLEGSISKYSYHDQKNGLVWCEEDCDAALFDKAAKQKDLKVVVMSEDHGDKSWIRALPRYTQLP